jgi:spore coat polysaccharide biosynthesis predicted glycosyltransferase SpsG/RimJ/RimL family protein N-acetyltransferase
LAVAQAWQRRGGRVVYLSAPLPPALEKTLRAAGIDVRPIDRTADAPYTAAEADRLKCAVVLVDHYELGPSWWAALPGQRRWRTAALNDFAEPIHREADLLISPRAGSLPGNEGGRHISGPACLLIRDELKRAAAPKPASPRADNMLVMSGGADVRGVSPSIVKWLLNETEVACIRVIVGPAAANRGELESLAKNEARLHVVVSPESMRPHYEWADTAICPPSTTVFEALHHGIAVGLVVTADNQREVAAELLWQSAAVLLCDATGRDFTADAAAWTLLSTDAPARSRLAFAGTELVDGRGADRACDLLGLPAIDLRPVRMDDAGLLLSWVNDPVARGAFFSGEEIGWEHHHAWMQRRLKLPDPFYLAVTTKGPAVAVIRFDLSPAGFATISLNLAPAARGAGLSALILKKACDHFCLTHPATPVHAWIKVTNPASIRCFEKAGFREEPSEQPDRRHYVYSP